MRNFLTIIIALLAMSAWGQTQVRYFYHWEKKVGTPDAEDVVLRCEMERGEIVRAKFYCTTDEWGDMRLGYLPGFYVLNMMPTEISERLQGIPVKKMPKGQFRMDMTPNVEMVFSSPVSTEYKSGADAWASGKYHVWGGVFKRPNKTLNYVLELKADGTLMLHGNYLEPRKFVPMTADQVRRIDRKLDKELEAANRKVDRQESERFKQASAIHHHIDGTMKKDDWSYQGQLAVLKSGERIQDGHGTMTWEDSTVSEDDFHWGIPLGKHAKFSWASGVRYEGEWPTGKGCIMYPNGNVYEGDIVDKHRTGHGRYTSANGNVYEGEFLNGKRHGQGVWKGANGRTYEGEFRNDSLNGQGKMTYSNGDVYQGEFLDGIRHGQGTYRWSESAQWPGDTYTGEWEHGERTGYGRYEEAGTGKVFEGQFINNVFQDYKHKEIVIGQYDTWNDNTTYVLRNSQPEFIGDYAEYAREHLIYPLQAKKDGVQGRVQVIFTVDKKGKVRKPRVLRNSTGNKELAREAVRFVKNMPPWKPAYQNGKPVDHYFVLPVSFKLIHNS